MTPNAAEQVKGIIDGITAERDMAKIEKMIADARGRMGLATSEGFWAGKRACWEMSRCPDMIRNECPAPKHQALPCWEIEGTYCKLDDYGTRGDDTTICEVCWVYRRWGQDRPIEIVLRGKGIGTLPESLGALAEGWHLRAHRKY